MNFKHLSIVLASLLVIGCGGGASSGGNNGGGGNNNGGGNNGGGGNPPETVNKNVTIADTEDQKIESLGMHQSIHATVNVGQTPKSLYVLLSNYSKTETASASITNNARVVPLENKRYINPSVKEETKILHAPIRIQEFNANIHKLLKTSVRQEKKITIAKNNRDVAGSSQYQFCTNIDSTTGDCKGNKTSATARKVVSNINTAFGNKTLNIWVSNDSFDSGSGCEKEKCVTQGMVNSLADTFLKEGNDNDIYDWVTNIFGEEWTISAQQNNNAYIGENKEITILLTDIGNDNSPTGGTIGYFWSKDNITKSNVSGSNERIMFYVDSVMFANGEGSWDINDFWPKELVATLAHEFQHMIHFYQKTILLDTTDDVWINEMLSETTEDLIATKIHHTGPRGVNPDIGSAGDPDNSKGRYPLFNENNTLSLTDWDNSLADYSKVSAFGTFLTRNYGGAKVLHDIMYNNKAHEDAIEEATGKSFNNLLKEWGTAVLLSNQENLENMPTYNTGDFTPDTYNGSTYQLGSINFYNYNPKPLFNTNSGSVSAQGNYYYKVGDNLTGTVTIDLSLNGTTEATLIAK